MDEYNEKVIKYITDEFPKDIILDVEFRKLFEDLGTLVRVWNIELKENGKWWVVEGNEVPMNLYPQTGYNFSYDEAYSFHMGITERMKKLTEFIPEYYVDALTLGNEVLPHLYRKLKKVSLLLDNAVEIEDFQSIGVQCREILIELSDVIYKETMSLGEEQPKASDFKKKSDLFVQYFLIGSRQKDYRKMIRKMTEATWDYATKITHSNTSSLYDTSTCVSLCVSLVGVYGNVMQKIIDPLISCECSKCRSKNLTVLKYKTDEDSIITKIKFKCEECNEYTDIDF